MIQPPFAKNFSAVVHRPFSLDANNPSREAIVLQSGRGSKRVPLMKAVDMEKGGFL
jgi:hypothetical protein